MGKKSGLLQSATPAACDLFEVQVVDPLRQLRNEGRIAIEEVSAPTLGRYWIVHVFLREMLDVTTRDI